MNTMSSFGLHASRLLHSAHNGLHRFRPEPGTAHALAPIQTIAKNCPCKDASSCLCSCAVRQRHFGATLHKGGASKQARRCTVQHYTSNIGASAPSPSGLRAHDAQTPDTGSTARAPSPSGLRSHDAQTPDTGSTARAPSGVDAVFTSRTGTRWRVRPYDTSDYAAIIDVQTNSFHTTNPVPLLNAITYSNFRAEVVDAYRQKTRYSDPSVFQLLIAEEVVELPAAGCAKRNPPSMHGSDVVEPEAIDAVHGYEGGHGKLVGVVEVSLLREVRILRALPAMAKEYAYVSSMCVDPELRRKGVAQALLAAAEAQARLWRQPHLTLDVYRDNTAAVQLYESCGMRVLSKDPDWKALLGDRVRLLMYKQIAVDAEGGHQREGAC